MSSQIVNQQQQHQQGNPPAHQQPLPQQIQQPNPMFAKGLAYF